MGGPASAHLVAPAAERCGADVASPGGGACGGACGGANDPTSACGGSGTGGGDTHDRAQASRARARAGRARAGRA